MAARPRPVTLAEEAQPEAEQRVVVHRVELDGAGELLARGHEPAGVEVGAPERLANGALVRFELPRALERDDCGVGALGREQSCPFLERVVGGVGRVVCFHHGLCDNRRPLTKANVPVPDFLPFRGVRYDTARLDGGGAPDLSAVVAPPYDVIDEERRVELEARHPHNAVRLILPRDERDRDRYQAAAERMAAWRAEGVLALDDAPRFYAYEMAFTGDEGRPRRTHGVVGALDVADEPGEAVLPHERTIPRAKSDRLALLRATRANLDPIWCLSLAAGLTRQLADPGTELGSCVDDDGVRHRVAAIDDPATISAVRRNLASAPVVIADGHHRFETARNYLAEQPDDDSAATRIMAFVVELTDDELDVSPIHRLLTKLRGADLRATLDATDAGPNTPEQLAELQARMMHEGGLGLVDPIGLAFISRSSVDAVDAAVFDEEIRPRLPAGVEIAYQNDAHAVTGMVDKGVADAAVLLRPVTVAQIRDTAFAGARMPEKTSFFHPKPRTGMVFRSLDPGE